MSTLLYNNWMLFCSILNVWFTLCGETHQGAQQPIWSLGLSVCQNGLCFFGANLHCGSLFAQTRIQFSQVLHNLWNGLIYVCSLNCGRDIRICCVLVIHYFVELDSFRNFKSFLLEFTWNMNLVNGFCGLNLESTPKAIKLTLLPIKFFY